MEGTYGSSVLWCQLCNKPFSKESTLKRHGYYCRSRKAVNNRTRNRSCTYCARGKARCDHRRPSCSRCVDKAIECQYPVARQTGKADDPPPSEDDIVEPRSAADQDVLGDLRAADINVGMTLDPAPEISDLDFADLWRESFGSNIELSSFSKSQSNTEAVGDYVPSSLAPDTHLKASTINNSLEQDTYFASTSIPPTPSFTFLSLNQRPGLKSSGDRTSKLILHTLKSYPIAMMTHNKILPPFIHQSSMSFENKYMEPLANSVNLLYMLSSPAIGSRKLFWRNVQIECERLRAECHNFGKWELLAGFQALILYILTRLGDHETYPGNLDSLLVTTVIVLATQFNRMDVDIADISPRSRMSDNKEWEDWVLEESARRLCVVYQIVNMVLFFEPAAMCDIPLTSLLLAPLPADKQLWEASNDQAWKKQRDGEPERFRTDFGLARDGELVRVNEGQISRANVPLMQSQLIDKGTLAKSTANWEEWCSGMDEFGSLIMLAASLIN